MLTSESCPHRSTNSGHLSWSESGRLQRTIRDVAEVRGVGLFTNAEVTVRFLPSAPGAGIVARRVDLAGQPEVPVTIEHLTATPRRTSVALGDARVEMVEHTLAALAGLQIDNCLIEVDGPELPGLDGSSQPTVDALLAVGVLAQRAAGGQVSPVDPLVIQTSFEVSDGEGGVISAEPSLGSDRLDLTYLLEHPHPVVGRQSAHAIITPDTFAHEIAPARTFVLMQEVEALRAAGYGQKLSEKDLCVFGDDGVIGNSLRFENEPARHKLLDCVGDFFLIGRPIAGRVVATRSGHALNHAFVRELLRTHQLAGAIGAEAEIRRDAA